MSQSQQWLRKILYYMLHLIFGGNQAYTFKPGDSVLVIEIGKDFVKYFKLTKPEEHVTKGKPITNGKQLENYQKQSNYGGTFLNVKSLMPPSSSSDHSIQII